jgi:hypothetical protein
MRETCCVTRVGETNHASRFTFAQVSPSGVYGMLMLISLWVITRLWTAPFHAGPEPVDLAGVVCKLAELLALVSLAALAFSGTVVAFSLPIPAQREGDGGWQSFVGRWLAVGGG